MIYTDKQRAITIREMEKFKISLAALKENDFNEPRLYKLLKESYRGQIFRFESDIVEYDMLKAGELTLKKVTSLDELPRILVQARVASGRTQTDLAHELGVKPQQIQRYETSQYHSASLARLIEISNILDVHVESLFDLDDKSKSGEYSWKNVDAFDWRRLPAPEMINRGWFDVAPDQDTIPALKAYFRRVANPFFAQTFHRTKVRSGGSLNEYALLAWQVRVLELAREAVEKKNIPRFVWDERWVKDLVPLTRLDDGPRQVVDALAEHGIVLITEDNLSQTYLDGAAMLNDDDRPVIGLTLRYDSLDRFWFVLFHELGHVFHHLVNLSRYDFLDDDEVESGDRFEKEADDFAVKYLLPSEVWEQCSSRKTVSEEAVREDAEKFNLSTSIIAGRIRRERKDYKLLDSLIGACVVSSHFV